MEGKDGKTERATPKKRQEERKKGNLCTSEDLSSMAVLFIGILALRMGLPAMWSRLNELFVRMTKFESFGHLNTETVASLFSSLCGDVGAILTPLTCSIIGAAVVVNLAQTKPYFSVDTLKWKISGLSPIAGVKKLFSMESVVKLGTSILKIALIVGVAWYMVWPTRATMLAMLGSSSNGASVRWGFLLLFRMAITVAVIFSGIAALDWCYRKRKYEKNIMMTKQEVKEERKQEEPSPVVKRAQAKKMREFTLMRMMAAVPKASVVITNPTHVAVALEYDSESMNAPRVVAKGMRLMAERIKAVAREHNVPVVERPSLARSLYKHVKLGREVPSQFYAAVAQVLAYIFRISRKRIASA